MKPKVMIVFGTRPEAIKLAPVVKAFQKAETELVVCNTGQHIEMVDQVVDLFDIRYDYNLKVMYDKTSLVSMTSILLNRLEEVVDKENPDWIIVQGDTASAFTGALVGFYKKVKVAHVEAGLRTYNRWSPFPEEINRIFIGKVTDIHFPPTELSANNLRNEYFTSKGDQMFVTGNTVVDALQWILKNRSDKVDSKIKELYSSKPEKRYVLMTCHRRESFGEGIKNICLAALELTEKFEDIEIIFPVHLNPNVQKPINELLSGNTKIKLVPPVDYSTILFMMKNSFLILSDSGGIQEEAPSLGKPLLILRDTTERPEAVDSGCAKLIGNNREIIVKEASILLRDKEEYQKMASVSNPFGDGKASEKIAQYIINSK